MIGKFVGLGVLILLLSLAIYAAVIAGGVWLVVYLLRALNVIA